MKINGFTYIPEFLSVHEEATILEELASLQFQEVKMYGVIAKRQVVHYGLDYAYNTRTVKSTTPPPAFMIPLITRSAKFLKIHSSDIDETLLTYYPIGASIGWHRDARVFGNKIFGISLGSECVMKFRKKTDEKYEVIKTILEPRSAYILEEDARWEWYHSISPVKSPRYSITFRTLKEDNQF